MKAGHLMCLVVALVSTTCGGKDSRRNQEQPLPSASGKYVLTVPIETADDSHRYWRVTITDVNGHVLFKDDSRFVGNLNVFWCWDDQDRVWLKNSDDGLIYYWEADESGTWRRYRWEQNNRMALLPPARLSTK